MDNKITGYLIDPAAKKAAPVTIQDTLGSYYSVLGCDTIDIVRRRIGKHRYTIVCDDNGLLSDDPLISAIDLFGRVMLVGAILIVNDDGPHLASLTADDISYIRRNISVQGTRRHPDGWPMLHNVSY